MNTKRIITIAVALVACASAMAPTGTAQAQRPGECSLRGCVGQAPSGRLVFLYKDGKVRDLSTRLLFKPTQSGAAVYTRQGWRPIANVQNAPQVWAAIQTPQTQRPPHMVTVGPMPGPVWTNPGASAPSGGGWHTPDCRNQRGAPCPGAYDITPYGDVNTNRDFNANNRPGNRR